MATIAAAPASLTLRSGAVALLFPRLRVSPTSDAILRLSRSRFSLTAAATRGAKPQFQANRWIWGAHRRVCSTSPSLPSSSLPPAAAAAADAPVEAEEGASGEDREEDPVDKIRDAAELLDIRVGRILRAWRHPEADSLYVEEVDIGEEEPRTICSGLVNYVPLDHLQDRKVVVLANLKPRNMRGVKSNGMLMAASDAAHENVELLIPPEGSVPGERIWFGDEDDKDRQSEAAATPNQVQKKKIWESVQPHLKTTDACVAVLCGIHRMCTSAGPVISKSLKLANIS